MKYKLFLWIFLLGGLTACQDDEAGFDVPVEFRKPLEFRPVPGGAVMNYYLSDNTDIFGVRVRYTNAWGEQLTKDGTYLAHSLELSGFTEARRNVPAQVSFFNSSMVESEPIEVTFDTENSAAVAVFDSLTVNSFWGGFSVAYRSPETVSGMIHVFYLGTNPLTHEPDSILMSSVPIVEGGDVLNFVLQQEMDSVNVIVRTDDYKGKRVKQRIVTGLPRLKMDTLTSADFDFKFTGEIQENETHQIGEKYLLDGDRIGYGYRKNRLDGEKYKYSTFVAGPHTFGERFIVDLRTEKVPAAVNLYAFLYWETRWPSQGGDAPYLQELWNGYYISRLPCKVKLYGTNADPETVDLATCANLFELGYDQDLGNSVGNSWAAKTDNTFVKSPDYLKMPDAELAAVKPVVLNMLCNYTGAKYRYLIFVVEDTFNNRKHQEINVMQYVTLNELEVCVKSE